MRAGGAAATGTDVESVRGAAVARWELYFLIHSFLDSGPCSETAQVLKRELTARGLLPTHGYTGTLVRMTPEDITARYAGATGRDLGGLLPALLERLVDIRASGTGPGPTLPRTLLSGGMQTLLQGHCHRLASDSVPPPVSGRATSSGAPPAGCYAAGSCSALRGKTPPHGRSMLQHVLARQQGCRRARRWPLPSTPNSLGVQYGRLYTLLAHFKDIFMAIFDRTGQRMVTGSDDKLVKIWNVHRGELLFSLRGHQGDITMIDINPANTIIASADTRGWVRVWRLCDGVPLVALRAHTAANTEPPSENEAAAEIAPREVKHISFLTHGDDEFLVCAVHGGTCPIWKVDTSSAQQAAAAQVSICTEYDVVRVRSNHNGGASRTLPSPSRHGAPTSPLLPDAAADAEISLPLTCCDVNASKTHIAVGCSDTNIYIFEIFPTVSKAAAKTRARSRRIATLSGHTKGVDGVRFGHIDDGSIGRLVSSSEDETVRIWSAAKASGGVLRYVSVACLDLRPPSLTRLRSPLRGGRGRGGGRATSSGAHTRLLSMKCEITMIAWSIDDSRVVTATKVPKADAEAGTYSAVLQVWDTGPRSCVEEVGKSRLLRALGTHGHAHRACVDMAVYVLVPHPSNKRLMLSAGYDGRAFIWDICSGLPLLRLMESPGTLILEGQFSGDGMNIVLCDGDGFLSVYGAGSPPVCLKEQFFLHDYGQLNYDHAGSVQDTAAQIAPHLMPRQLCDSESTVYPRVRTPLPR
jgi:WD40 repeat protein